jgi:hypothetical protein
MSLNRNTGGLRLLQLRIWYRKAASWWIGYPQYGSLRPAWQQVYCQASFSATSGRSALSNPKGSSRGKTEDIHAIT